MQDLFDPSSHLEIATHDSCESCSSYEDSLARHGTRELSFKPVCHNCGKDIAHGKRVFFFADQRFCSAECRVSTYLAR